MFSLSYDIEHAVASGTLEIVSGMEHVLEGPSWEIMGIEPT